MTVATGNRWGMGWHPRMDGDVIGRTGAFHILRGWHLPSECFISPCWWKIDWNGRADLGQLWSLENGRCWERNLDLGRSVAAYGIR